MGYNRLSCRKVMDAVIVFLKNYNIVEVKTRLAKDTSKDFALNFYKKCVTKTINEVKKTSLPYYLFWFPEPMEQSKNSFSQKGKNLGERMYNALNTVFSFGFNNAIIIGTDIPDLNKEIILKSFKKLEKYDYVIGPCFDGGYYLIGCGREKLNYNIFSDILWSSDKVLENTENKLKKSGFKYFFLKKLMDIDEAEDFFNYYSSKR